LSSLFLFCQPHISAQSHVFYLRFKHFYSSHVIFFKYSYLCFMYISLLSLSSLVFPFYVSPFFRSFVESIHISNTSFTSYILSSSHFHSLFLILSLPFSKIIIFYLFSLRLNLFLSKYPLKLVFTSLIFDFLFTNRTISSVCEIVQNFFAPDCRFPICSFKFVARTRVYVHTYMYIYTLH